MAMTREEERELRLNCSIGSLLGNLSSRSDLKKDPSNEESKDDADGDTEGVMKRSAEDQGGVPKKPKEESHGLDFFRDNTADFYEDDPDWVIEEKKYLIEEYGKKIVTLCFDEKDRFFYTCEVCQVDCNQRKMLEAHCVGMKHLRKKTLLDRKLQGKDVPDMFTLSRKSNPKPTKPSDTTKPSEREPPEHKKKWHDSNYYNNYGQGKNSGFYNQPPPFGPPPPGFPGPPASGPPPNYYGQWDPNTPNIFNTPPPSVIDGHKNTKKDSLAGGDTGSLLQKLADCAVKNETDSDLAINVVIALMKSLKDFNHKRGETKFIEVLTEADVTFRVLKTMKPTNKDADNSSPHMAPGESHDTNSSSATGVSEFVQETPSSNFADNSQYYSSQSNHSSNSGYPYGSGSDYSSMVPTGVPPPANYPPRGANGYNQDGSNQNYGPNQNQGYDSNQVYGNQGTSAYYNQGQDNTQSSTGYTYPEGSYPQATGATQSSQGNQGEQGQKGGSSDTSSGAAAAPPPPPPPPSASSSSSDSTPDFSNYGYAAGYSMGYYSVRPPTFKF